MGSFRSGRAAGDSTGRGFCPHGASTCLPPGENRPMTEPTSMFDFVNQYFDRAAASTTYPKGLLEVMKACKSVYRLCFPFRHPDGTLDTINAWRVEHSHHKMPTKG